MDSISVVKIEPHRTVNPSARSLEVDLVKRVVTKANTEIHFSNGALNMLIFLIRAAILHPGRTVSYQSIEVHLWGKPKPKRTPASDSFVDVHRLANEIRNKLQESRKQNKSRTGLTSRPTKNKIGASSKPHQERRFLQNISRSEYEPGGYCFIGEIWSATSLEKLGETFTFSETEAGRRQKRAADALGVDVVSRIPISKGETLELTFIPGGTFRMGRAVPFDQLRSLLRCPISDDEAAIDLETPAHTVQIRRPFFMGTTPVTLGQYRAYIEDTGGQNDAAYDDSAFFIVPYPQSWKGKQAPWVKLNFKSTDTIKAIPHPGPWRNREGASWHDAGFPQDDLHPVVNVSWNDAKAFCKWLSNKTGKTFRLPWEAEWEYSCRAGSDSLFYWGNDVESAFRYCNGADRLLSEALDRTEDIFPGDSGFLNTSPVRTFRSNAWGLFDMLGNVSQWCEDHAAPGSSKYSSDRVVDPRHSEGDRRVLRGGNWYRGPVGCRSAARVFRRPDGRSCLSGFRVIMESPAVLPPSVAPDEFDL